VDVETEAVNAAVASFAQNYQDVAKSFSQSKGKGALPGPASWQNGKGGSSGKQMVSDESWDPTSLAPDIADLCRRFDIDDNRAYQLSELLEPRKETRDEDVKRLWNDLERSRNPMGLLITKIKQLREGTFVGQWLKPDPEMQHFKRKFNLDSEATRRLEECVSRHSKERRQKYYAELELHLEASHNPSALIMMQLKKIANGEDLGEVKEQGGNTGKGKAKGKKGEPEKDDNKGRRGSRSRSNHRQRSRSRRAQRDEGDRSRRDYDRDGNRDGRFNDFYANDRDRRDSDRDNDRERTRDRDQYRSDDRKDDGKYDVWRRDDKKDDRRSDQNDRDRDDRRASSAHRDRDDRRTSDNVSSESNKAAEPKKWGAPKFKITG